MEEERERERERLVPCGNLPSAPRGFCASTMPTKEEEESIPEGEADDEGGVADGDWDMPGSAEDLLDLAHLSRATCEAMGSQ